MDTTTASLLSLDALRDHVLHTLCRRDHLDAQQTPLHQSVISRSGRPCGVFFQIQGSRMLKSYAVWAESDRRILFYDAVGVRFAETRLKMGPDLTGLAQPAQNRGKDAGKESAPLLDAIDKGRVW